MGIFPRPPFLSNRLRVLVYNNGSARIHCPFLIATCQDVNVLLWRTRRRKLGLVKRYACLIRGRDSTFHRIRVSNLNNINANGYPFLIARRRQNNRFA